MNSGGLWSTPHASPAAPRTSPMWPPTALVAFPATIQCWGCDGLGDTWRLPGNSPRFPNPAAAHGGVLRRDGWAASAPCLSREDVPFAPGTDPTAGFPLWDWPHAGAQPPRLPPCLSPTWGHGDALLWAAFLFLGGGGWVVREATGVPKLKRNLLEDIRLGQGLLLPWEDAPISTLGMGRPRHPLVSKRGQKSQRRKKEQLWHTMQCPYPSSTFLSHGKG